MHRNFKFLDPQHLVDSVALAGLLAILGILFPLGRPASAAAVVTGPSAGLVVDLTWGISRPDIDRSVTQIVNSGASWVRMNVNWKDVEPGAGSMNPWWLSTIDYATRQIVAHGISILMPIADGVPYWASADPAKYTDSTGLQQWNQYWRPTTFQDYSTFVGWVVRRYAPMGVHAYEIWNEPNFVRFWPSGPNPADYVSMLRAAFPAVKANDPGSVVVLGGLSTNDYFYLGAVYAAGGKDYFDVTAVHPYSAAMSPGLCWKDASSTMNSSSAFCGIDSIHQVMVAYGDDGKPIWLTEFGWSTCLCVGGVSAVNQASYLTAAFARAAGYPYVKRAFVYSLRDDYWLHDDPSSVEANYGLLKTNFSNKIGFTAFQLVAANAPR